MEVRYDSNLLSFSEPFIDSECNRLTRIIYILGEKTNYSINIDGKVKNIKTGKYLSSGINKNRYVQVSIFTKDKIIYRPSIHRLVGLAFIPNDDPVHKTEINHLDYDKTHNHRSNLEWCTPEENMIHAGRKYSNIPKVYTDVEIVHQICKMLEENKYSMSKISKILEIDVSVVYKIHHKKNWTSISSQYNIDNYTIKSSSNYTDDEIRKACELLSENKKTLKEIEKISGVKKSVLHAIIDGYSHRNISQEFSIEYNVTDFKTVYDDEQIHLVCKLLEENKKTMREISNDTGVPMNYVSDILRHKKRKKISMNYNIDNYTMVEHREEYDKKMLDKMNKMIISGKSNSEIREKLQLPKNSTIKSLINNHRIALRKVYLKNNIEPNF